MNARDISSKYPEVAWTDNDSRWSVLVELDEPHVWHVPETGEPRETKHLWVSAVYMPPTIHETAIFAANIVDRAWGFEVPSWEPLHVVDSQTDIAKALASFDIVYQPSILEEA